MSVTLTTKRTRPDDDGYAVIMIGINYASNRVVVRVRFNSGDEQDIIFEGPKLLALRNGVSQFAGLRLAIEQHLTATEPGLGGTAT